MYLTPKKKKSVSKSETKEKIPKLKFANSKIQENKITKYFQRKPRTARTPGFKFASVKQKVIIENYQNHFFSPKKKRKIILTDELREKIKQNKKKAMEIREVNKLLSSIRRQKSPSSFQFTSASNFVSTQDVANCLLSSPMADNTLKEGLNVVLRDRKDSEESDSTLLVSNPTYEISQI